MGAEIYSRDRWRTRLSILQPPKRQLILKSTRMVKLIPFYETGVDQQVLEWPVPSCNGGPPSIASTEGYLQSPSSVHFRPAFSIVQPSKSAVIRFNDINEYLVNGINFDCESRHTVIENTVNQQVGGRHSLLKPYPQVLVWRYTTLSFCRFYCCYFEKRMSGTKLRLWWLSRYR